MEPDSDQSILEYARFHGIARPFELSIPPDILANFAHFKELTTISQDLQDASTLFPVPERGLVSEKLSLAPAGRALLHSVLSFGRENNAELQVEQFDAPRFQKLKIDEPLLSSDHEQDVRYCRRAGQRAQRFKLTLLPQEIDVENDEGIEWPSQYLKLGDHFCRLLRAEKLDIPKSLVPEMTQLLSNKSNGSDEETFAAEMDGHREVRRAAISFQGHLR